MPLMWHWAEALSTIALLCKKGVRRGAAVLRAGLWVGDYMSGVRRVLCFNADFEINVPRVAPLASLAPT